VILEALEDARAAVARGEDLAAWLEFELRMGWLTDEQANEIRAAIAARLEAA